MSYLLRARNLVLTLQGDDGPIRVLDGVNFSLAAGELVDLVGPSGAGKTMLLRALTRLVPLQGGSLQLEDCSEEQIPAQEWRTRVALLPQIAAMQPGSVRGNLLLPWTLKIRSVLPAPDDRTLRAALDDVGLDDVALDRNVAKLSVGQTARVSLLRVLLTEPRVLLLDEPDANLDDASADRVTAGTAAFVGSGGAVVRVRHHRGDRLAARRLRLHDGVLAEEPA